MLLFVVVLIIAAIIVFAAVTLKRRPTNAELRAVVELTEYVLRVTQTDKQRAVRLRNDLEACLAAHDTAVNNFVRSTRSKFRKRISEVIDKEFLHSAYKARVSKKWKAQFEVKCKEALEGIMRPEEMENKILSLIGTTLQECEEISRRLSESESHAQIMRSSLDSEVTMGLSRMLAHEKRLKRFVDNDQGLHDAALVLFASAEEPQISFWDRFKDAHFSLRELVATLESPKRLFHTARSVFDEVNSKPLGVNDIAIDGGIVILGLAHTVFHLSHDAGEALIRFAVHTILGEFSIFVDVIWNWVMQWMLEHFGQEALQEAMTFIFDVSTGLIVLTAVWRVYRYAKLAQKLTRFWNGDDSLPELRTTILNSCTQLLEKVAENARNQPRHQVQTLLSQVDQRIIDLERPAINRRAWAMAQM